MNATITLNPKKELTYVIFPTILGRKSFLARRALKYLLFHVLLLLPILLHLLVVTTIMVINLLIEGGGCRSRNLCFFDAISRLTNHII